MARALRKGRWGGRGRPLAAAVRVEILGGVRCGSTWPVVADQVGVHVRTVARVVAEAGGMLPDWKGRSSRELTVDDREEISRGLRAGEAFASIGRRLGRPTSTVSREVGRNGGRAGYRAWAADRATFERARRPKPRRFQQQPALRAFVENGLEVHWSPRQISARLPAEFPDDEEMRVSHETIYQALFVQGRGGLRAELTACLRTGRARRRPQRRGAGAAGKKVSIKNMVMISERPAEVEDRAVPGHWEGDLLIGKDNKSAIATLVERTTRFVMLVHLGRDRSAPTVARALERQIMTLPAQLRRSLTWDQGGEMAEHRSFTIATGIPVYFCDPHSPWMRGSNENTNGLLRQYFPKGTPLSGHSQDDLDRVAAELNGRPRQTLRWMTPSEAFNQLVATTP